MAQDFSMVVETRNFNRHIAHFARHHSVGLDKVLKKFAFDLLKKIIMKHPVKTGRARAGWYVSIEGLGQGSITVSAKGPDYDEKEVAKGKAEGDFIDHTKGHVDKWVELVNGVNYIVWLEYGHSTKQAPFGMVRISMRELAGKKLPQDMTKNVRDSWNKFYYV